MKRDFIIWLVASVIGLVLVLAAGFYFAPDEPQSPCAPGYKRVDTPHSSSCIRP